MSIVIRTATDQTTWNKRRIFILHSVAWLSRWTVILLYFHWFPSRKGRYCPELRMPGENQANIVQSFTCAKFIVFRSLRLLFMVIRALNTEYTNNHSLTPSMQRYEYVTRSGLILYMFDIKLFLLIFHSFAIESASLTGRDSLNIPIPLGLWSSGRLFFAWFFVVYVYFDDGNGHLGSQHPFWCTFLAFTYAIDGNCCGKKLSFLFVWNAEWSGGKNKNRISVYDLKGKW